MLGSFLEFGVAVQPVGEAFEFYRSMGFQSVPVGDILNHPYAVVADGDICIGLHERPLEGPLLTFVRPQLADYRHALRRLKIEPEFSRLGAEEFNEIGFRDPDDQLVTLLEARTFSPGSWEGRARSVCGRFLEFSLATSSAGKTAVFWQELGMDVIAQGERPHSWVRLRGRGLTLGLHETALFTPGLTFEADGLSARTEFLKARGMSLKTGSPLGERAKTATLTTPGDGAIYLLEDDLPRA